MLLKERLKAYNLILASGSPRRQAFLKLMDLDFEIRLKPVDEVYPNAFKRENITDYLSQLKAEPFKKDLKPKDILITSDTIVWHRDKALEKPKDSDHAFEMIKLLSNDSHEVATSICLTTMNQQITKHAITKVTFSNLSDEAIKHYIEIAQPFDKAGSYGIQEWIGAIGIVSIEGSYNNVVGLPTHLLYETLNSIVST